MEQHKTEEYSIVTCTQCGKEFTHFKNSTCVCPYCGAHFQDNGAITKVKNSFHRYSVKILAGISVLLLICMFSVVGSTSGIHGDNRELSERLSELQTTHTIIKSAYRTKQSTCRDSGRTRFITIRRKEVSRPAKPD